ncbi:MAG: Smr/MutS family protein, partial [Treponemataceae bacterium]
EIFENEGFIIEEKTQNVLEKKKRQSHKIQKPKGAKQSVDEQKIERMLRELQYTKVVHREKSPKKNDICEPILEVGCSVLITSSQKKGILLQKNKKNAIVQLGSIKLTVNINDLQAIANKENHSFSVDLETSQSFSQIMSEKEVFVLQDVTYKLPAFELKILGLRLHDAVQILEQQIDLACIKNLKKFAIVHGKGAGVLQTGVQNYLKNRPEVASFYFARPEDGGSGKTYVELK